MTGIAWEFGVLAGLSDAGFDLRADAVFGTSAGAFVGAALAGGADLVERFAAQEGPAPAETFVRVPRSLLVRYVWAYLRGGRDPERIAAAMGAIARRRTPLVSADDRRRTVSSRLVGSEWPTTLHVTAIDAVTGRLRVFGHGDGVALIDAVSASGAVPGISPPVQIEGRLWIDGGMVTTANARLADGFDDVVVVAPLPDGHGGMPSVRDEVQALRSHSTVQLIVPDRESSSAIGRNLYDPARRPAVARAGRAQGARISSSTASDSV